MPRRSIFREHQIDDSQMALGILNLIARFSHLRTKDVARYFKWTEFKARRNLNLLLDDKLLLAVVRPDRTKVYGLSATGSKLVKSNDSQAACASSLKYLRSLGNYEHRCKANDVCIYFADTYSFSTEYEIQTCAAPIKSLFGKIPDALIYTDMGTLWVEVELSKRNEKSWYDLIRWFVMVFSKKYCDKPELSAEQDLYILRVEFYCHKHFENLFYRRLCSAVGEMNAIDLLDCYAHFTPLNLFDNSSLIEST
jgi:hypothetical protein